MLNRWNQQRREAAERYDQFLAGVDRVHPIGTPAGNEPIYHLYVVRSRRRRELARRLNEAGIGTGLHYPLPLHLQKAYRFMELHEGSLPVAEKAAAEVLSLPMFPNLLASQQERVAAVIRDFEACVSPDPRLTRVRPGESDR